MTSPSETNAAAILKAMLEQWGIGDLYADALKLIKQGLDDSAVLLQLQESDTYKRRFSANEDRKKKGLSVLSPAEYVANENQYKQVLRMYGLPAGFYDSNDDVRSFLANDVSPSELASRAQAAQKVWVTGNQDLRSTWRDYYGLSDGDAIAALLDPATAMPIVEQRLTATQIGAAARRQALDVSRQRAEELSGLGVDEETALSGYGQIGESLDTDQSIAARFGQEFTLSEEEDDRLLGLASAKRKRRDLYGQEAALFNERTGSDQRSLSRTTAGGY